MFLRDDDFELYRQIVAERCELEGVVIDSYCLMPNHVHHVAVPDTDVALHRAFGVAHQQYALQINRREGWTGHLWQERFFSSPLDERYHWYVTRYVAHNPVRAGLVDDLVDWRWGSARALLRRESDPLVVPDPTIDWHELLRRDTAPRERERIRRLTHGGFPLGAREFVEELEARTGRCLHPRRRGRRPVDSP